MWGGKTQGDKHFCIRCDLGVRISVKYSEFSFEFSDVSPSPQAALCGHLEVTRVLLRHGADAGIWDSHGDTPAHIAGARGHLVVMSELLQVRFCEGGRGGEV